MEAILKFSDNLDISLFDKVVSTLYQGKGSEVPYLCEIFLFLRASSNNKRNALLHNSKSTPMHGSEWIISLNPLKTFKQRCFNFPIAFLLYRCVVYRFADSGTTHTNTLEHS